MQKSSHLVAMSSWQDACVSKLCMPRGRVSVFNSSKHSSGTTSEVESQFNCSGSQIWWDIVSQDMDSVNLDRSATLEGRSAGCNSPEQWYQNLVGTKDRISLTWFWTNCLHYLSYPLIQNSAVQSLSQYNRVVCQALTLVLGYLLHWTRVKKDELPAIQALE